MDKFLKQKHCDGCGMDINSCRIMSMFNQECICMVCKEKETKDPRYKKARDREHEEVKKGNYNFKGLGK